jgi:hypothetical protein
VTGFDDSGTDLLDVGTSADLDRYQNNLAINGTGWANITGNLPDKISTAVQIQMQYDGQNNNAAAGMAEIYIHYTLH